MKFIARGKMFFITVSVSETYIVKFTYRRVQRKVKNDLSTAPWGRPMSIV